MQLLTAVQMSSAIPILISPVCIDNKCYIDGGVICNYPINQCVLRAENVNEILGLRQKYIKKDENIVKNESTILEYVMNFISLFVTSVAEKFDGKDIPNELIYDNDLMTLSNIQLTLSSKEERQRLIDFGIDSAKTFLLEKRLLPEQLVEKIDAVVLDDSIQELGQSSL